MNNRLAPSLLVVVLLVASTCLQSGCHHVHYSEKNRPGRIDVSEPPPQMDEPERVKPEDPGAFHLFTMGKGLIEIGGVSRQGGKPFSFQAGAEWTLGAGVTSTIAEAGSWQEDDQAPGYLIALPEKLLGLSLGWLPYSSHDRIGHRLFAEALAGTRLGSLGLGWNYLPGRAEHGPQLSVRLVETFYVRFNLTSRADWTVEGWSLMSGISLPLASFFHVQSR
ncbi:MAG: hypothetical protein ACQEVA_04265 [Myxococcota bacterium]